MISQWEGYFIAWALKSRVVKPRSLGFTVTTAIAIITIASFLFAASARYSFIVIAERINHHY